MVVLYSGIAFFDYDDRTFWSHFAQAVIGAPITPSTAEQTEINAAYGRAAQSLSVGMVARQNRNDFVGSAVYQAGIPISLWSAFLEVCEWATWRRDWKTISGDDWSASIQRIAGNQTRLKNILIDGRESVGNFIQEVLDARDILTRDHALSIDELAYASILRHEYFEEVPETAEFLRPQNPESLFRDKPKLVWQDQRSCISLYLPGVAEADLPGQWRIDEVFQNAAPSPDEMALESAAFKKRLAVQLISEGRTTTQIVRGLDRWALFDLDSGGRHVNRSRDELPLRSYAVVSQSPLKFSSLEGFVSTEHPQNEKIVLSDGSNCYVTRLWPTGRYAAAEICCDGGAVSRIQFRAKARLESRFFFGRGYRSAFFERKIDGSIETDSLPRLCVVIPKGYFRDNFGELKKRFRVLEGDRIAGGEWSSKDSTAFEDRELYVWGWSQSPFIEPRQESANLKSLEDLGSAFRRIDMSGRRTFHFEASDLPTNHVVELVYPIKGIQRCWRNLPGSFLPWFLLCQAPSGMTWEDLLLAKDAVSPELSLSPYLLRRYAKYGLLAQYGQRWRILDSRAALSLATRNLFQLSYCGDPSNLWALYRDMQRQFSDQEMPTIEIKDDRAFAPYLSTEWPLRLRSRISEFMKEKGVSIVKDLWIL